MKMNQTVNKLFWSINEFCAAVGIGRTKAYAEIKAGRLRPRKVGSRTILPQSEIDAWTAQLEEGTSCPPLAS